MSTIEQRQFSRRTLVTTGAAGIGVLGLGLANAAPALAVQQTGWRWCSRCQVLFYGQNTTTGWCPVGGGHDWAGSGMYTPAYGEGERGQDKWRWCRKCQGMWWGGSDSRGKCPAGGGHSRQGSGDYRIRYGNKPPGKYQGEWRWCRDCYGMCYSGNGNGRCPDGGGHDFRGSGAYFMPYE